MTQRSPGARPAPRRGWPLCARSPARSLRRCAPSSAPPLNDTSLRPDGGLRGPRPVPRNPGLAQRHPGPGVQLPDRRDRGGLSRPGAAARGSVSATLPRPESRSPGQGRAGQAGALEVRSVYDLWRGADWLEREVYDMFGVTFVGHPDLRRILMWETYAEGYPAAEGLSPAGTLQPGGADPAGSGGQPRSPLFPGGAVHRRRLRRAAQGVQERWLRESGVS